MSLLQSAFYGSPSSSSPSSSKKRAKSAAKDSGNSMIQSSPSSSRSLPPSSPSSPSPSPSKSRRLASQPRSPSKSRRKSHSRTSSSVKNGSTTPKNTFVAGSSGLLGTPDEHVQEDGQIIRCTCGSSASDGFMLQCDECDTWQHGECVEIYTAEQAPETYWCLICRPSERSKQIEQDHMEIHSREAEASAQRWERQHTPPPSASSSKIASEARSQGRAVSISGSDTSDSDIGLEIEQPSPLAANLQSSPYSAPSKRSITSSPSTYAASRALLASTGTPSKGTSSPLFMRPTPAHPLLTPPKKRTIAAEGSADELDPLSVSLPEHYTTLLSLHAAVERALLLHLATEGSKACGVASSSPSTSPQKPSSANEMEIDLPSICTYTTIRGIVERGANKRFSPIELGQLVWLWEGGLSGPYCTESTLEQSKRNKRGGLSFSIIPTRELDRATGKKVYTWGIGISLTIKANAQLPQFEIVDDHTASPSSNGPASPMPNLSQKRTAMSVLPLWSSKADYRKQEMRRRLGECVIKAHRDFGGTAGPSKTSAAVKADNDDPFCDSSPVSTPNKPRQHARSASSSTSFKKGFILDALPPIPSATLPPLGPASHSISPVKRPATSSADTDDAVQKKTSRIVADVDASLAREESGKEKARAALLNGGTVKEVSKANPKDRAMSLLERIKAKETAASSSSPSDAAATSTSLHTGKLAVKKAALSSLESASARAKKREDGMRSKTAL